MIRRANREALLPLPVPQIAGPFLASLAGSAAGSLVGVLAIAGLAAAVRGGWL